MSSKKSSLGLNLSNQANMNSSKRTDLSQYNTVVILGLEGVGSRKKPGASTPLSIKLYKNGELEINGLDEESAKSRNICIYSDKKLTKSDDN